MREGATHWHSGYPAFAQWPLGEATADPCGPVIPRNKWVKKMEGIVFKLAKGSPVNMCVPICQFLCSTCRCEWQRSIFHLLHLRGIGHGRGRVRSVGSSSFIHRPGLGTEWQGERTTTERPKMEFQHDCSGSLRILMPSLEPHNRMFHDGATRMKPESSLN